MFAHAAFEQEVRLLQDAITDEPGFGEQPKNQWNARDRPKRMSALIALHLGGDVQETKEIVKLLTDAIKVCEGRNLLAHGEWWVFYPETATIGVRGGVRWDPAGPPVHREFTASEINALVEDFRAIETEVYKRRRSIEDRYRIARSNGV
jgi:hypothetical protein